MLFKQNSVIANKRNTGNKGNNGKLTEKLRNYCVKGEIPLERGSIVILPDEFLFPRMLAVAVDDVRSFHFRRTEVALVTLDDVTQLVAQYFVQIKAQENRGQHVKLILKYGRFSRPIIGVHRNGELQLSLTKLSQKRQMVSGSR